MNCADFEKPIALYLEGDLPGRRGRRVEEHLKACPACREFAEGLKATQAALKSLGQETVDDAVFRELRAQVLGGISAEKQPGDFSLWRYALVAGLIALVGVLALVRKQPAKVRLTAATASVQKKAEIPALKRAARLPARLATRSDRGRRTHPRRKPGQTLQATRTLSGVPQQLMVKLVTDDPNLVIYWLVD